jgi:hypothetical protein
MTQVIELDLLQMLGHDEFEVLGVEHLPAALGFPEYLLVYKDAGPGKADVIAYEVRIKGVVTDYVIRSVVRADLRVRH